MIKAELLLGFLAIDNESVHGIIAMCIQIHCNLVGGSTMLKEELRTLTAPELREVIDEAKRLLKRKKLYIREITKPSAGGRYVYLYATWQEEGKTRQKSLGRKETTADGAAMMAAENDFSKYGIYELGSVEFLESMVEQGYFIAN